MFVGALALQLPGCGGTIGHGSPPAILVPTGNWPIEFSVSAGDQAANVERAIYWVTGATPNVRYVPKDGRALVRITGERTRGLGACKWRVDYTATSPARQRIAEGSRVFEKNNIWSNVEGECEKLIAQSVAWAIEGTVQSMAGANGGSNLGSSSDLAQGPIPAELAPTPGGQVRSRAVALVVGIEKYRRDLPEATGARSDAALFAAHLETAMGLQGSAVHVLVDSDATRSSIDAELAEWLPRNASPADDVFFFFAGHGAPDPQSGTRYLVPWDADPKFIASQGIEITQLVERLGRLRAARVFAFVDSCFSGAGGRSVLAPGTRPLVLQRAPINVAAATKLAFFAASGGNEITGAIEGHGLFSYFLFRGLHGDADANKDGAVTFGELVDYTSGNVANEARRQNRDQHPQATGSASTARGIVLTRTIVK